jgi:predicted DNA-binding protein with PD1-like motif
MGRGLARWGTHPLLPPRYMPPRCHLHAAVCRCYAHKIACHYAQCADVCIAEVCGALVPTLVQVTWHSTRCAILGATYRSDLILVECW